ncbi:hypothetical protein A1O1_09095 [Capronia coronata CBS 617.96]|uniref:Alcohol dehydrogenase n=1 Tax=Capronia coronata CBS 617.96 TaxID=1182541 RepID=W9XEN3_9EURO|nr:uncharacterized protein A1O1_09095 [Capronia coronata CBS 617.96]EXJ78693.1 hypothetical protein A1O1_09095 [Capronia coronata CBS 617.96]
MSLSSSQQRQSPPPSLTNINPNSENEAAGQIPFPANTIIHSPPINLSHPIPTSNLPSKTILITGGASGFGATCCRSWASHHAIVIIGDINARAGEELVAEVRQSTGNQNLHFIQLDVTSWTSQVEFFDQAARLSPHGGIDCVIANAGIADAEENRKFEEPEPNQIKPGPTSITASITTGGRAGASPDGSPGASPPTLKTIDVNLYGVLYTTHLALHYLPRNPGSRPCDPDTHTGPRDRHLLLVSSIAGLAGLPSQPLYAAAKHAVVGLFRTLRMTAPMKCGVRVNMINPYFVDTPILGPLGALLLAGGGMATLESVLQATTRLVADQGIIGRALVIGPKTSAEHARAVGLEPDIVDQAVWDVYAHDFEQSDLFTRRVIGVTNLITRARGWTGLASDIANKASYGFWKMLGY